MRFRWLLIGLSGALVILGAGASTLAHQANPWFYPEPLVPWPWMQRELASAASGMVFAILVILFTRVAVRRTTWARRLHQDLRPVAQQLSPSLIVVLAILSSTGEELLFRSLLIPWIGVVPQAIVFGLLHQIPGPSRWVWVIWATVAGFVFGAMYQSLGTLTGPVVAHGLINAVNLMFLRNHDPEATA